MLDHVGSMTREEARAAFLKQMGITEEDLDSPTKVLCARQGSTLAGRESEDVEKLNLSQRELQVRDRDSIRSSKARELNTAALDEGPRMVLTSEEESSRPTTVPCPTRGVLTERDATQAVDHDLSNSDVHCVKKVLSTHHVKHTDIEHAQSQGLPPTSRSVSSSSIHRLQHLNKAQYTPSLREINPDVNSTCASFLSQSLLSEDILCTGCSMTSRNRVGHTLIPEDGFHRVLTLGTPNHRSAACCAPGIPCHNMSCPPSPCIHPVSCPSCGSRNPSVVHSQAVTPNGCCSSASICSRSFTMHDRPHCPDLDHKNPTPYEPVPLVPTGIAFQNNSFASVGRTCSFHSLGRHSPDAAASSRHQGNMAFRASDFVTAIAWYGKALQLDPTDARSYSNRSTAYLQYVRSKLRSSNQETQIWGKIASGDGDGDEPNCSNKTVADMVMFRSSSSMEYLFQRALADAIQCCVVAPHWYKGWSRRGDVLHSMGRVEEASQMYEQALILEPENKNVRKSLEQCWRISKR